MKNIPLKHLSGFYPYSLTGKISNFIFRSSMFESLLGYCDYGRLGNAADCGSCLIWVRIPLVTFICAFRIIGSTTGSNPVSQSSSLWGRVR